MAPLPKILVTRPEPDATDTAARLNALGLDPVIAPLLELQVLETGLPKPEGLSAIALTSANALRALEMRGVLGAYRHLPVFTVGERTAAHVRDSGFTDVTSADGAFDDLVTLMQEKHFSGPVFYPVAANASGDLAAALAPKGILVIAARLYDMHSITGFSPDVARQLAEGTIAAVSLYSRHTAEIFCALAQNHVSVEARSRIAMLCLSENVAAPLIAHRFTRIALADYPSEEAMMALALSFARDQIR